MPGVHIGGSFSTYMIPNERSWLELTSILSFIRGAPGLEARFTEAG